MVKFDSVNGIGSIGNTGEHALMIEKVSQKLRPISGLIFILFYLFIILFFFFFLFFNFSQCFLYISLRWGSVFFTVDIITRAFENIYNDQNKMNQLAGCADNTFNFLECELPKTNEKHRLVPKIFDTIIFNDEIELLKVIFFFLFYICNSHVLNHFLLIYMCKLHWNLNTIEAKTKLYEWYCR